MVSMVDEQQTEHAKYIHCLKVELEASFNRASTSTQRGDIGMMNTNVSGGKSSEDVSRRRATVG